MIKHKKLTELDFEHGQNLTKLTNSGLQKIDKAQWKHEGLHKT